jgi:hypothetical protein
LAGGSVDTGGGPAVVHRWHWRAARQWLARLARSLSVGRASSGRVCAPLRPRWADNGTGRPVNPPPRHDGVHEREPSPSLPVALDLSRFVALEGVLAEIDELVATLRISPVAPATLVALGARMGPASPRSRSRLRPSCTGRV